MKKITSVLLSALLGLGIASGAVHAADGSLDKIKARDKLIIGVFTDKPPFGYVDEKGNYVGFDTDLGRRFARICWGTRTRFSSWRWSLPAASPSCRATRWI